MPSCAFSGYMASFGTQYYCLRSYVPDIMRCFDMGDLAVLIARFYYAAVGVLERFERVNGSEAIAFTQH